jgi:DNA-binding response OmpR family regulator
MEGSGGKTLLDEGWWLPPEEGAERGTRRVVVLDPDESSRRRTEQLLCRHDYWALGSADARTALRLVQVDATDLVVVDLAMGALEAVPRWQRRQADFVPREVPPPFSHGYAVLRALQADPACARFPLVALRSADADEDALPVCRFGIVDYAPKAEGDREVLQQLDRVFRDIVEPGRRRMRDWQEDEREQRRPRSVLSFPRAVQPVAPPPDAPAAPPPVHARPFDAVPQALRSALIVDPDTAYRRRMGDVLAEAGFLIHEASRSEEALRIAIARRPWLILAEVGLPDESGFEMCERVRSHSLLRRTPLVFHSEWDDYDKRHYGLRLGADDYLSKHLPVREVVIRLQLVLNRYSDLQIGDEAGSALSGTIDLVGAPGLLQMFHLNRLTGVLEVRRAKQEARIGFRQGEIVSAELDGLCAEAAVYAMLSWTKGQFDFTPASDMEDNQVGENFEQLLLEGCRRLDEARRA